MKTYKYIKVFTDRYPFLGPLVWILSVQYFIIQFIAAQAYRSHYSILQNSISDLGNTACQLYSNRFVCSPLHSLMNYSFVILGSFMALGALLIYQEFKRDFGTFIGFSFMAISGIGAILVGVFPENSILNLHLIGATTTFLLGSTGMIILGFELEVSSWLKVYSLVSGFISLLALILLAFHAYLSIGFGGIERITAYPQTIWLIVFGLYMSRNRFIRILKRYSNNKHRWSNS